MARPPARLLRSPRPARRPAPAGADLRVALDLSAVISGTTGVAKWGEELWSQLLEHHHDVTVVPFAIGRGPHRPELQMRRIRVPLRIARRVWRVMPWPPIERVVGPADLLHAIDGFPPATRLPLVLTVHDVLPIRLPELYGEQWIRVARAQLAAARRADVIVTHCEATADDIAAVGGIPRDRIAVALPGHRRPSAVAPASPVEPPFILAVGAVTPRKGFHVLAEAAARIGPACPPVVIAGPDFWRAEEVRARIDELGMTSRVRFLGRVSDTELEGLYRAATVVCHPSVAEGFGIPFLEGMGYGAPVVAADIPPVREIGAGAAELVPPSDPGALAEALSALLADDAARQDLARRGYARAQAYTWEAMADRVVDAYRLVLT